MIRKNKNKRKIRSNRVITYDKSIKPKSYKKVNIDNKQEESKFDDYYIFNSLIGNMDID